MSVVEYVSGNIEKQCTVMLVANHNEFILKKIAAVVICTASSDMFTNRTGKSSLTDTNMTEKEINIETVCLWGVFSLGQLSH